MPAVNPYPIVKVRSAYGEHADAELRETDPRRSSIAKIVYLHSRTAAWIDRRRIIETDTKQQASEGAAQ